MNLMHDETLTMRPRRANLSIEARILAAIAISEHRLMRPSTSAIRRRTGLTSDAIKNRLSDAVTEGLVIKSFDGNGYEYSLTEAGWAACGQTPPIWRANQ